MPVLLLITQLIFPSFNRHKRGILLAKKGNSLLIRQIQQGILQKCGCFGLKWRP
jgi:hypothetical protein